MKLKKVGRMLRQKNETSGKEQLETLFTRGSSISLLQRRATGHDDSQLQFSTVGRAASVILAAE